MRYIQDVNLSYDLDEVTVRERKEYGVFVKKGPDFDANNCGWILLGHLYPKDKLPELITWVDSYKKTYPSKEVKLIELNTTTSTFAVEVQNET